MADNRLDQFEAKYGTALRVIEQQHLRLHNLHVQDNKLSIRATAPSQAAKPTAMF